MEVRPIVVNENNCGKVPVGPNERNTLERIAAKSPGMYLCDVHATHRPATPNSSLFGVDFRYFPHNIPVAMDSFFPFHPTRFASYGVSFLRIREEIPMLADKNAAPEICRKLVSLCYPALRTGSGAPGARGSQGATPPAPASLEKLFDADAPHADKEAWMAELDVKSSSYLGIYRARVTVERQFTTEYWIGVQTGAPRASAEFIDTIRVAGGKLHMHELAESAELDFVRQLGYRVRQRLIAGALDILGLGKLTYPDMHAARVEHHARVVTPTIDYSTYDLEYHKDKNECVYYAGLINANRVFNAGNKSTILAQTPYLGAVLMQLPPKENPTWVYPYSFPVAPGTEPNAPRIFDPAAISVPLLEKSDNAAIGVISNIYFGVPLGKGFAPLSADQRSFFSHRLSPTYYRDRVSLSLRQQEQSLGLPAESIETPLEPMICVLTPTLSNQLRGAEQPPSTSGYSSRSFGAQ